MKGVGEKEITLEEIRKKKSDKTSRYDNITAKILKTLSGTTLEEMNMHIMKIRIRNMKHKKAAT